MGQRHMLPHPLKAWSLDEWGMPNCFNRRFHLIWRWLLLVVTRSLSTLWCSNDLLALRSVGCPAPPLGCLRDLFSLILSPSTATPPGKKKERLTRLFKNSEAWTQATWLKSPFWFKQSLVKFSSGLDAVVFIHWLWLVMSCWLGTVSLTINLIVLQPTNPRKC